MTDNPFLREVIDHPDDDQVRLIYADYLEEQGDPRGEFIRVQCELASTSSLDPRYEDLFDRSSELLIEYGDRWAQELNQNVRKIEFERGFISTITILARQLAKPNAQPNVELFDSTPVNWLRLNRVGGAGAKVAVQTSLSRIRRLDLSGLKIPIDDLLLMLQSPHLDNLVAINLDRTQTTWDADLGRTLATMASVGKLEDVSMVANAKVSAKFIQALTAGDSFSELRRLRFGEDYGQANSWEGIGNLRVPKLESLAVRGKVRADQCVAMAKLPLSRLKQLDLKGTRTPAAGLKAMASEGALDQIEELQMGNCHAGVRTCDVLFSDNRLQKCRVLSLGDYDASNHNRNQHDPLIKALSSYPLPALRRLEIRGLSDQDLAQLLKIAQLGAIESFAAPRSLLVAEDLAALALSSWPQHLRALDLRDGSTESSAGLVFVEAKPNFQQLLRLDLSGGWHHNEIAPVESGDDRLIAWLSCGLPSLQHLRAAWSQLSDNSLDAIASVSLPELRRLDLEGSAFTPRAIHHLLDSQSSPKLRYVTLTHSLNRKLDAVDFEGRVVLV